MRVAHAELILAHSQWSPALAGIMHLQVPQVQLLEVVMKCNMPARTLAPRARSSSEWRRFVMAVAMVLMTVPFIGACASGHSHRGANQEMIVHLTNDLAPPSDVTVYAITQDGTRRLLGDVPPNKDRVLKVPGDIFPGTSFRIVAERTAGRAVVSQPISATSTVGMIDWDLQTNAMWFPEPGE
jgi:hypothetical protein